MRTRALVAIETKRADCVSQTRRNGHTTVVIRETVLNRTIHHAVSTPGESRLSHSNVTDTDTQYRDVITASMYNAVPIRTLGLVRVFVVRAYTGSVHRVV